jgi:hypothetical protein
MIILQSFIKNFAAVAMETKKRGFKKELIPFIKLHEIL